MMSLEAMKQWGTNPAVASAKRNLMINMFKDNPNGMLLK
jgi:hypothetical protein